MKIGIMGGTFNPIHNGHLMIADYAYHNFHLDEIWFLPNGNPPHKDNPSLLDNSNHRKEMVQLAIAAYPHYKLCNYELDRTEKSYSYSTMETFSKLYPEYDFYFIVGADSLFSLEKWKHPERLLKVVTMLATYRDDIDKSNQMNQQINYLNQKYQCDIRLLHTPLLAVSSSDIRNNIKHGVADDLPVPDAVASYIKEHRLYQE